MGFWLGLLVLFSTVHFTTLLKENGIGFNALPVQVILMAVVLSIFFKTNHKGSLIRAAVSAVVLFTLFYLQVVYTNTNLAGIFMNALTIYFFLLVLFSINWPVRRTSLNLLVSTLNWLFILYAIVSSLRLLEHIQTEGWSERFKGFGSGTNHGIYCVFGILYFVEMLRSRLVKPAMALPTIFVLLVGVVSTQSRGVFVSLVVCFLLMNMDILKKRAFYMLIPLVAGYLIIFPPQFGEELQPFLKRFNPAEFEDVEQFTSGRLQTQEYIVNWFFDSEEWVEILLGNGLNSMKRLPEEKGYEYPHLDPLYIVYEGGLCLLLFYIICSFQFVWNSRYYLFPLLLVISGFHANFVLIPQLMLLAYLLSLNSRIVSIIDQSA